jgi:hypothetical protein
VPVDLVREHAVDDHRIGQVPVEVQVGERPHRLRDDHAVGRHHEADDACSASRSSRASRPGCHEALDLGERPVVGQRQVEERARERPRGGQQRVLAAEQLVQPPARGVREREQPQRLTRRRAVDDHDVPLSGVDVLLERQQLKSSSPPGGTVSSSAAIRSTPRSISTPAQPALHRRPVALELVLCLDLLCEQAAADVRRRAADGGVERLGQRAGRVGGEHDRARAVSRATPSRGRRDRRLADSALARVEDRPGRHGAPAR